MQPGRPEHPLPGCASCVSEGKPNPNDILPPEQPPDLLEDTALPADALMEAFDKAFAWQQEQEQEQEQQPPQQHHQHAATVTEEPDEPSAPQHSSGQPATLPAGSPPCQQQHSPPTAALRRQGPTAASVGGPSAHVSSSVAATQVQEHDPLVLHDHDQQTQAKAQGQPAAMCTQCGAYIPKTTQPDESGLGPHRQRPPCSAAPSAHARQAGTGVQASEQRLQQQAAPAAAAGSSSQAGVPGRQQQAAPVAAGCVGADGPASAGLGEGSGG